MIFKNFGLDYWIVHDKYIIGEISGSGGTTLYKNLSDTVLLLYM